VNTPLAPPTATPGARARVIVVDDEPLVGRSIRRALRGHEVEVFTSGQEAIARLCSGAPFDVVFCDLMMPQVSGMEVFRRVCEQCPDVASRFVFMTGGAFTQPAREFLERTPVLCLEKPFELRQIRDLVTERAEPVD
jgi:CheY-like chemotaxis protein